MKEDRHRWINKQPMSRISMSYS